MALVVGQVLYLPCRTCVDKGRLKFFVVAFTWPEPRCFLINTEIAPLSSVKPTVARTQVRIYQSENTFLKYDSWLDCSILKNDYTATEMEALVAEDPSVIRGAVSTQCRAGVRAALEENRLLPREFLPTLRNVWA